MNKCDDRWVHTLDFETVLTISLILTAELFISRVVAVHHAVAEFAVQGLRAQPVGARAVSLVTAVGAVHAAVTARGGRHVAAQCATREVGRIGAVCQYRVGWKKREL